MIAKSLALVSALLFLAPLGSAPARAESGEIRVDTLPHATHSRPAVAVFPDGGFVVVWTVSPAPGAFTEIHARLFDRDGDPATDEFRLLDRAAGSQVTHQVVADQDGSFLLAWTEIYPGDFLGSVFVRRFHRDATPRGDRIRLNRPGVQGHDPVVAIGTDRRFAVAWQSFAEAGEPGPLTAAARTFTAEGAPLSGELRIGAGTFSHASPQGVAFARNGSLLVLVEAALDPSTYPRQLWIGRVPAGAASPNLLRVSDYAIGSGAALTPLRNGSLIAIWSGYSLLARRLSPAGAPRGDPFQAAEAFDVVLPRIAPLANGGYVVLWSEWYGGYDVFSQAFAANGAPLAPELRINVTIPGHHYGTAVAAWPGGPVVAVWQGEEGAVFARVLPIANP